MEWNSFYDTNQTTAIYDVVKGKVGYLEYSSDFHSKIISVWAIDFNDKTFIILRDKIVQTIRVHCAHNVYYTDILMHTNDKWNIYIVQIHGFTSHLSSAKSTANSPADSKSPGNIWIMEQKFTKLAFVV